MMQPPDFEAAVQAARHGHRAEAFHLMRNVIMHMPQYAPAWLWMSSLVDDPQQQRDCLERALTLDPNCAPARHGLEMLRLRDLYDPATPPPVVQSAPVARKLGDYLVESGFITQYQLDQALSEQAARRNYQGEHPPLGDILIRHGWLTPQMLATTLVTQQEEKMRGGQPQPPRRLGEHLVMQGIISPNTLATALAEQAALRQSGAHIALGELLLRGGHVTPEALTHVLDRQIDDLFRGFKD